MALFYFDRLKMIQQIILRDLRKPKEINLHEDIEWLGESFGFSAGRDINRLTDRILKSLLEEISKEGLTSTEQISKELDLDVQRVNYHLRTFVDSGFVCREKRMVVLRQGSVKAAVEEMRQDAKRIFDNLSVIAEEIDLALGLRNRRNLL